MTCASRRLCFELVELAGEASFVEAQSVPWHSSDLSGERHCIRLSLCGRGAGTTAERLARTVADHEFAIPGVLVADVAVIELGRSDHIFRLDLEALTLNDFVSSDRSLG